MLDDEAMLNEFHKAYGPPKNRPHSIDQALELERELDNESLAPSSPRSGAHSLDPEILASIITQLRGSLTDVTKERDDLVTLLSEAHAKEADLKDALAEATERHARLQEELDEAKMKMQADEDTIRVLRSNVEESRRGLMRLQKESRRASQMSIMSADLQTPILSGPPTGKRAPFTPLTGSSHARITSVSDPSLANNYDGAPSSPKSIMSFSDQCHSDTVTPPKASRRISGLGFFGRSSPPDTVPEISNTEVEALKRELKSLKSELEETRHELTEASEAKEASETCVKALRDFISENGVGHGNVQDGADGREKVGKDNPLKLPLPPSMTSDDEADEELESRNGRKGSVSGGWGLSKLWRVDTTAETGGSSGPTTAKPSTASPAAASTTTPTPLRKLTGFGFFGARGGSVSSTASSTSTVSASSAPMSPRVSTSTSRDAGSETDFSTDGVEEPLSPVEKELMGTPKVKVREQSREREAIVGRQEDEKENKIPSPPTTMNGAPVVAWLPPSTSSNRCHDLGSFSTLL